MKSWYKYLVYISLLFLTVALYKSDYLKAPQISSSSFLIVSIVFLFAGFIGHTISWKQILKKSNYPVNLSESLSGVGLSIFGKYIPGKIWMIMGRAAYIAEKNHESLGKLSVISLNAQFITLWIGLALGGIGLFILGGLHIWGWLVLFLWLGLTAVIFSKIIHGGTEHLIKIILRKNIKISRLAIKSTFSVMPWFFGYWASWSIGFYMLVMSLTEMNTPWSVGLGFPLAGTLGIMAIIAPGGLGAREGVMVGYLTLADIPIAEATTIAATSRLWFLIGEVFIFIVGLVMHKRSDKKLKEACKQNVV